MSSMLAAVSLGGGRYISEPSDDCYGRPNIRYRQMRGLQLPVLNDQPGANPSPCGDCDGKCCRSSKPGETSAPGFTSVRIMAHELEAYMARHGHWRLRFHRNGDMSLLMRPQCHHLGSDGSCTIYPTRPLSCRHWYCMDDDGQPSMSVNTGRTLAHIRTFVRQYREANKDSLSRPARLRKQVNRRRPDTPKERQRRAEREAAIEASLNLNKGSEPWDSAAVTIQTACISCPPRAAAGT